MLAEESVHYSLTDPEAYDEWLWTAPIVGDNHVRLGPDKRMFAVPMFHELHCLRNMRTAMVDGLASLSPVRQGHIHHCFNYLRQWALCSADVTLEPGDFMTRNFTTERTGGTYSCLDWTPVYKAVEENWYDWEQYRDLHGLATLEQLSHICFLLICLTLCQLHGLVYVQRSVLIRRAVAHPNGFSQT